MTDSRDEKKLSEKINKQEDYREEDRTPLDQFKDQQFVDDIPLDDLKIELAQERKKHKTQDESQSTNKYAADFDKK